MGFANSSNRNPWNIAIKQTRHTKNSDAALAADPDLKFDMVPGGNYIVRARIHYFHDVTPSIKWRFNINGGTPVGNLWARWHTQVGTPTSWVIKADEFANPGATITGTANSGIGVIILEGHILPHASSASNFQFEWAQNTSNAGDTIVYEGSFLEYLRRN